MLSFTVCVQRRLTRRNSATADGASVANIYICFIKSNLGFATAAIGQRNRPARARSTKNTTSANADTSKHAIRPSAKMPTLTWRNIPSAPRLAKHPQIKSSTVAAIGKYRTRGRCPNFVRRRPENAIVSAKINMKAPITRLAIVQTISSRKRKKNSSIGSNAKKRAPILAPNIHDKDQVSRGCQPVEDPPRVATTNPENPARATAICETVRRNPWLSIFDAISLTKD